MKTLNSWLIDSWSLRPLNPPPVRCLITRGISSTRESSSGGSVFFWWSDHSSFHTRSLVFLSAIFPAFSCRLFWAFCCFVALFRPVVADVTQQHVCKNRFSSACFVSWNTSAAHQKQNRDENTAGQRERGMKLWLEVFTEDPRPKDLGPVQVRVYILNGQLGPGRVPIYCFGSHIF